MPWSQPFRSICRWFTLDTQPIRSGRFPDKAPPRRVKPLLLQRWVAQALAARFAWLEEHPDAPRYRFVRESEPWWTETGWTRAEPGILRVCSETLLREFFVMEVERLLRIADAQPTLVGPLGWACAVLGASEHIIQFYGELKRRHKAMQARAILRAELSAYICWGCPAEEPLLLQHPSAEGSISAEAPAQRDGWEEN